MWSEQRSFGVGAEQAVSPHSSSCRIVSYTSTYRIASIPYTNIRVVALDVSLCHAQALWEVDDMERLLQHVDIVFTAHTHVCVLHEATINPWPHTGHTLRAHHA